MSYSMFCGLREDGNGSSWEGISCFDLMQIIYVPLPVVNSLMCYTCTNQTSNDQCLKSSLCTKNETACVTIVEKIGAGESHCYEVPGL